MSSHLFASIVVLLLLLQRSFQSDASNGQEVIIVSAECQCSAVQDTDAGVFVAKVGYTLQSGPSGCSSATPSFGASMVWVLKKINATGDDVYTIINKFTGKAMTAVHQAESSEGKRTVAGTDIPIKDQATNAQKWKLHCDIYGNCKIENLETTGYLLDFNGGSYNAGTSLIVFGDKQEIKINNQSFKIILVVTS